MRPLTLNLKSACRSAVVLIWAVLLSVQLAAVIVSVILSAVIPTFGGVRGDVTPYLILGALPLIPMMISAWLIFGHARSRTQMNDSGFAVLSLMAVIASVVAAVLSFIFLASVAVELVSGNYRTLSYFLNPFDSLTTEMASACVYASFFLGVMTIVMILVFLTKTASSLSYVRSIARRGRGTGKVSVFVPVGCFVFAAVTAVSASAYFFGGAWMAGICECISVLSSVFAGIFAVKVRRAVMQCGDSTEIPPVQESVYPIPSDPQYTETPDVLIPQSAVQTNQTPAGQPQNPDTSAHIPNDPYVRIERRDNLL